MPGRAAHKLSRVALAIALAMTVLSASVPAVAAPSSAVEQKQEQRTRAVAELEKAKADIARQVTQYVELGRKIQETQGEVAQVQAEIGRIEGEIAQKKAAFQDRAVQLYRSNRTGMLEVLLGADSFQDFWARAHYLVMINERDRTLIQELRLARSESLWLENSLGDKIASLTRMQEDADKQRVAIEARIDSLQKTADELGQDIASLMAESATYAGGDPTTAFNRDTVISDAQFRASDSMTVADIQAFLNRQPGTLKAYRAPDYAGRTKSAAEMIFEAAVAWRVNPKVILVKLQKEQSLLGDSTPSQNAYDWAMGCGKADSRTYYEYQGFGKQIWFGASKLDKNSQPWEPGISMKIDGSTIHPSNASTYSLYKYTPHFKGTMSFWMLHWRYFGDPLAR